MVMRKLKRKGKRRKLPVRFEPGFLREFDRRTDVYKRATTAFEEIIEDAGGHDALTHVQLMFIERFVFLEALLQTFEAQIAEHAQDEDKFNDLLSISGKLVQAINSLSGVAAKIPGAFAERVKGVPSLAELAGNTSSRKNGHKKVKRPRLQR